MFFSLSFYFIASGTINFEKHFLVENQKNLVFLEGVTGAFNNRWQL